MNYEKKYLKYKKKYLNLSQDKYLNKKGGGLDIDAAKEASKNQAIKSARERGNVKLREQIEANPSNLKPYNITKCNILENTIECPLAINKVPTEQSLWKLVEKISAQGTEGEVYLGYLTDETELKIIKYINIMNLSMDQAREQIQNEVCLQNIAAIFTIAPPIVDYWLCEQTNTAVIVMEKGGTITLNRYLQQVMEILDTPDINNNDKLKQVCNLYFAYKLTIMKLIKLNHNYILHLDFHLENILVSLNENGDVIDVRIIDFGKSFRLDLKSQEAHEKMIEKIGAFQNIKCAMDFAHYATLVSKDYYAILKNETNGILVHLSDYKRGPFKDRLLQFCEKLDINSIYYYYILLVISKELNSIIEKGPYYEDVNDQITNMYDTDIDGIIQEISTLIKIDIEYLSSFGVKFNIEEINIKLNEFEDELDISEFKQNIKPIYTQILTITTQL